MTHPYSPKARRWSFAALLIFLGLVALLVSSAVVLRASRSNSVSRIAPGQLKIMNYYPADAGWEQMWRNSDESEMNRDFGAIHELGANAVRIIVQPSAVGYPTVTNAGSGKLQLIMDLARKHRLEVQLTLFDYWHAYREVDRSERWVKELLSPYRDDPSLALVELQNEINPISTDAIAWARTLLPYLKSVVPNVPRTIDVRGTADAGLFDKLMTKLDRRSVDVLDIHLYGHSKSSEVLLEAAERDAAGRPVIVGEAGASTYGALNTEGDARQLAFYRETLAVCRAHGIQWFAPWILNDFTASGNRSGPADNPEAHFGVRTVYGAWKPAAGVVRQMFSSKR